MNEKINSIEISEPGVEPRFIENNLSWVVIKIKVVFLMENVTVKVSKTLFLQRV